MAKVKALIYRILFFLSGMKDRFMIRIFLRTNSKAQHVFFVDIDNTIADTWPSFLQKWPSEANRLASIPAFEGMKNYLRQIETEKGNLIIYLTARNIRYKGLTQQWLQSRGFPVHNTRLVLVATPGEKLPYIKMPGKGFTVTYIDDLAFGHETGQVKKYETVINAVKKLPLTYVGSEEINIINEL